MTTARRSHLPAPEPQRVRPKDMRGLIGSATRLVLDASRSEAIVVLVMVVLQSAGVFVLLYQVSRLLGGLIDADGGQDTSGIPQSVLLVVAANCVILVTGAVLNNKRLLLAERTSLYVRRRILDVACLAELDDYDDAGYHDRLERATNSAVTRPMRLVEALLNMTRTVFALAAVAVALLFIQPWVALIVSLVIVPVWLGGIRGGQQHFDFVMETTPGDRDRDYRFELLTKREAAKEIRAYNLGEHLSDSWQDSMNERLGLFIVTLRKRFRSAMLASLGGNAIVGVAAGLLIFLNRVGFMSLAEAATTAGALMLFSQKMIDAVDSTNDFFEAAPLIRDLEQFLSLKPELLRARPAAAAAPEFREIVVDDISFTYKGAERPAIDGVSMRIGAGEVVALVGENGSGKTTLTKLLGALYTPDSGQILVDGVDVAGLDPTTWRARIAVLFQDFLRYALPATDNIRFGSISQEPTPEAIREAARAAGADEFLARLPHGYDTILSPQFEQGQDLSLGQWQRVALARAFFASTPLVILDEPTASLDARAERALFDAVRELYTERTVLLISHRFSTVRTADRIVVLAAGRVVEEGTHEQLMQADGLYAELFTLQASGYLDSDNGDVEGLAAEEATPVG